MPPPVSRRPTEESSLTATRLALLLLLVALILLSGGDGAGRPAVRRSLAPPDAAELDRLAARAGSGPLFAAAPEGPDLVAFAPPRPRAGRNGAVDWRVRRGPPGDTVRIVLLDAGGPLDSARVRLDSAGSAAGSFRVRPQRPGWHAWSVRLGSAEAAAGGWVLPPDPLRILVAAAAGSVEAREVARALERGGISVTMAVDLGRGLTLGDSPPGPGADAALDSVDGVFILAAVPIDDAARDRLRAFVRRGGGVLIAGAAAGAVPGIAVAGTRSANAGGLLWQAPAELEPLPPLDTDVEVVALDGPTHAARLDDAAVLILSAEGRGRWAALGLLETWRWALGAGRTGELGAFWTSLAGWLAGGATGPLAVDVTPATAPPGLPIDIRLATLDSAATRPAALYLVRPDGRTDSLPVAWQDDRGYARFMATADGPLEVRLAAGGAPVAGHLADGAAPASADAWAALARIAAASGGRLVPADSLDALVADRARGVALRPFLAAAILVLAIAGWAARRLRGLA